MRKFKYFRDSDSFEKWQAENPSAEILEIVPQSSGIFVLYTEKQTTVPAEPPAEQTT